MTLFKCIHDIDTQNNILLSRRPRIIYEVPLHDIKLGVWCAVIATRKIVPHLFADRIDRETE